MIAIIQIFSLFCLAYVYNTVAYVTENECASKLKPACDVSVCGDLIIHNEMTSELSVKFQEFILIQF